MRPHLFALRLLLIITDTGTDKQIHQLFTEAEQPIYYQFVLKGPQILKFLISADWRAVRE